MSPQGGGECHGLILLHFAEQPVRRHPILIPAAQYLPFITGVIDILVSKVVTILIRRPFIGKQCGKLSFLVVQTGGGPNPFPFTGGHPIWIAVMVGKSCEIQIGSCFCIMEVLVDLPHSITDPALAMDIAKIGTAFCMLRLIQPALDSIV